jgi:hypothetical protein
VWGVWTDGVLYLSVGGHPTYRNLRDRGDAIVHVDDADQVVILAGRAAVADESAVIDAYKQKYGTAPGPGGMFVFRPSVVHAWDTERFQATGTRWRLD